jgi:hypothetical protein
MIVAKAQNVETVLDETYVPKNNKEQHTFQKMNDFMMQVFVHKFTTSQAIQAIQENYQKPFAAQKVWKAVREHHEIGQGAKMASTELLRFITTSRWGKGEYKWTDGTESYVRYFANKIREYEIRRDKYYNDEDKITFVTNMTDDHPDLFDSTTFTGDLFFLHDQDSFDCFIVQVRWDTTITSQKIV